MSEERFSERHGFEQPQETEITVRQDAPYDFRGALIQIAYECGFSPKPLRQTVCRILRKRPDENNWSEFPNIDHEVHELIDDCQWYKVYDIVEGISEAMYRNPYGYKPEKFEKEINYCFIESGIGWQLRDGKIEIRGPEQFETLVRSAEEDMQSSGRSTAESELREALNDLSRRPEPDITGAIQHSMASLECVARDVTGNPKATLGDILNRCDDLIPKPLDGAVKKAWGYASQNARHIEEGREPDIEEAELMVGICATVSSYLIKKKDRE